MLWPFVFRSSQAKNKSNTHFVRKHCNIFRLHESEVFVDCCTDFILHIQIVDVIYLFPFKERN